MKPLSTNNGRKDAESRMMKETLALNNATQIDAFQ